jgi:hypothetical protein
MLDPMASAVKCLMRQPAGTPRSKFRNRLLGPTNFFRQHDQDLFARACAPHDHPERRAPARAERHADDPDRQRHGKAETGS